MKDNTTLIQIYAYENQEVLNDSKLLEIQQIKDSGKIVKLRDDHNYVLDNSQDKLLKIVL